MSAQGVGPAEVKDAWDRIAGGFDDAVTPLVMPLADETLRRAGLGPGMRFLDVAAGSGALSIPAARLGASVLATDVAPMMVERLEARARAEKLTDVEGRVMDGYALDLEDDTFDVTGSQNGVSLFPDVERGLSEMVRVTKPGGRVLVVAFGDFAKAEFLGVPLRAIKSVVPGFSGPPMDPPPLPFQLADPERMRRELADAGLRDVRVDAVTWRAEFQSPAHVLAVLAASNPIGAGIVAGLTPAQKAAVEEALGNALRERGGAAASASATLNTELNVGIGTK